VLLLHIYSEAVHEPHAHAQMSAQSEQIKQNFLNHPYTQQASKFFNGQVSSLDAEVSSPTCILGIQAHG